ncbi:hypothetical protein B0H11DRAFT_1252322 [Mycena galericulata]|nr:hypothetical protein B0H11DRAFT_1252322 [Mycena galericulata]
MESQGYQGSPHHNPSPQNRHAHWSSTNNTFSQIANPRYENGLNNPQRPSIVSNLSANTNSTCPSAETSPLPSPSFQAELQATGVHSTPWSQPAIYSLQPRPVSPRSTTPTMLDSQRTPDPRKRIKLDANQTTPPAHFATPTRGIPTLNDKNSTSTTTTTTHITQISSTTTNSPKRPTNTPSMLTPSRAIPLPSTPQGCRIPSEVRKRTISLRARPLRSSSRDRKGPQPDEREAGEVFEDDPVEARPGYNSSSSESP